MAQYRAVLKLDSGHASARQALAVLGGGDGPAAEPGASTSEAAAAFLRGREHFNRRRFPEAMAQFRQALELDPDQVEAHYYLALALTLRGELDPAADHYREVLLRRPDSIDAHYNLGVVQLRQGKPDGAVQHFEQALRLNPEHLDAHYALGSALLKTGQAHAAVSHFEEALRINPSHPSAPAQLEHARAAENERRARAKPLILRRRDDGDYEVVIQ